MNTLIFSTILALTVLFSGCTTPEEDILAPVEVTAERKACLPQFETHCALRNQARLAQED